MTVPLARIGVVIALLAWPALVVAQAAGKPAPPPAATPAPATPPPEPYTYDPEGRRDPFVNLLARGAQPTAGTHVTGLSGLSTGEVAMSGVVQVRGGAYVALVKAPDGKTYQAHVNDKLTDGTIRSITLQGMVIMQEVNDPLSLVKVKEVRKGLRASDDVKQ